MKIAVLPLNAAQGTPPSFGRQFSAFAGETLRGALAAAENEEHEVQVVSYLAQIEQDGQPRAAYVNVAETLVEFDFLKPLFEQGEVEKVVDGLVERREGGFNLTYRVHEKDNETPIAVFEENFDDADIFKQLHLILVRLAEQIGFELPEALKNGVGFGTESAESFLNFLEGYDAFNLLQQSNGAVAQEFVPEAAYESLLSAVKADPEFLAPYETLCAMVRTCGRFRIGSFEGAERALLQLEEMVPDDFRASYSLGEVYGAVNDWNRAIDTYERSIRVHEQTKTKAQEEGTLEEWMLEHASLYSRIGIGQINQNMPVNAELNFRKAIEMEGDDKPSLDLLAQVLVNTNRAHEVPGLWKTQMERQPDSGQLVAKYALSLMQAQRENEAIEVFDKGLDLEDNLFVKRYYAPVLAQRGDLDRAMDFYEDCIDVAGQDIQLLMEYAETLRAANREFEVPAVLDQVLEANPDPNTRAQVLAWKTEIQEPRRAEAVRSAEGKLERGDFEGVVRELRPLRNWLADYWKLWAALASAHNRLEQPDEAQEAAERLLGLFPGYEPGYAELMAAFSQRGQYEEAYNVMRYAANQIQGSLGIAINLALAAKRSGREDEARQLSRQIREAVGNNEELKPVFDELEGDGPQSSAPEA